MGKPAPGFDLKIVDDKGNDCPARVEGEIVVQTSPNRPVGLFSRYVVGYDCDRGTRTMNTFACPQNNQAVKELNVYHS